MILQSKLLALVNEVLGQNAKLRKGGSQATYFCPFCNHYKRKLEVNLDYGKWHCWVCHAKGSYLGSLLTKLKAARRYREKLFQLTKDVRLQRKIKPAAEPEAVLPVEFQSLMIPWNTVPYRHAMSYLKTRQITLEDISRYNIGFCDSGEYKDCIVIPSYDAEGKLNYFSCRYFYPHKWFKYKNAPCSKNVVGFECFVNYEDENGITLSEGCFDAISIRNNAIPLFGTNPPTKLLERIVMHKVKRVNICLDSDATKESLKIYDALISWAVPEIHLVILPEKDPSVMGFDKIHDLITNSCRTEMKDIVGLKLKLT